MTERLTTEVLTQVQLEAIRKRASLATEGPWATGTGYEQASRGNYVFTTEGFGAIVAAECGGDCVLEDADAEFIAHARTDIPALLAEVERLRAENTDLRIKIDVTDQSAEAVEVENERLRAKEIAYRRMLMRVREEALRFGSSLDRNIFTLLYERNDSE